MNAPSNVLKCARLATMATTRFAIPIAHLPTRLFTQMTRPIYVRVNVLMEPSQTLQLSNVWKFAPWTPTISVTLIQRNVFLLVTLANMLMNLPDFV